MVDLYDYIKEDYISNKESYELIKQSVICYICREIMVKPVMCMNCQNVFCRRCIEHWNNLKNYCPYKCPNPEYKKCVLVGNLLSSLEIICKDCESVIKFDNMERHVLSKCDTVEINYQINKIDSNDNRIFQKLPKIKKDKERFNQESFTRMKSKNI